MKVKLSSKAAHKGNRDDVDPPLVHVARRKKRQVRQSAPKPRRRPRKVISDKRAIETRVIAGLKRKSVTAIASMLMLRPLGEVIFLEGRLAESMRG